MKFIPFKPGSDYSDRNKMPLKLGDVIMIDEGGFAKENYRPLYKIIEAEGFQGGINWDTGLVSCRKLGLKNENSGKIFIWEMNWIIHVVNGEMKSVDLNAINLFVDARILNVTKEHYGCFNVQLYL